MTRKRHRVEVDGDVVDVDLDKDPLTLPSGKVLDEKAAAAYGREVADRAARRRGRPSLTKPGVHSPQLSVRVSPALKRAVEAVAVREGKRTSEVLRQALEDYVVRHAS